MKPVTQSRTGENGTCFRACIASILELPEAAVPDWPDANLDPDVNRWLGQRGLRYEQIDASAPPPLGLHIIQGLSPRGGQHAIVGKDGRPLWDPHPQDETGRFLVRKDEWGVLLPSRGRAKDEDKVAYVIYRPPGSNAGVVEINGQKYYIDATHRLVEAGYKLDVSKRLSTNDFGEKSTGEVRRWMRGYPVHPLSGEKAKDSMLSGLALQAAITPVYTRHNEIKATPRRSWQEVSKLLGETKALLDASRISDKAKWQMVLAHASSFLAMARDAERQGDNPHFVGWTERAFMMTHHVLDVLDSLARRTTARDEDKFDRQAAEYVQRHNAASKEYKAAFKAVGARMWPMDNAHEMKPYNQQCIAESLRRTGYKPHLPRPLTVLNSYPDVTPKQRKWLDTEVDRIYQKYGGKFGRDHATDTHWEPGGDVRRLWLEANAPYGPGDLIKLPNGKITEVTKCLLGENLFHEPEYHVSTKTGECVVVPVKTRAKDGDSERDLGMVAWGKQDLAHKLAWLKKFDIDPKWAKKDITDLDPYDREALWKALGAAVMRSRATDSLRKAPARLHRALDAVLDGRK